MSAEQQRVVLTLVWTAGFAGCIAVVSGYMFNKDALGNPLLSWRDVLEVLQSVVAIYAAYLGAILASWFTKPFAVKADSGRAQIRFWVALVGAATINLAFAVWLGVGFWGDGVSLDDIKESRLVVGWLSFLAAPASIYYFGVRTPRT
ncbi:MAG: hypothetical protein ACT4P9_07915 [Betaproteobacteria bacterium]